MGFSNKFTECQNTSKDGKTAVTRNQTVQTTMSEGHCQVNPGLLIPCRDSPDPNKLLEPIHTLSYKGRDTSAKNHQPVSFVSQDQHPPLCPVCKMKLVALMLCGLLSLATAYPYPDEELAKIEHTNGTDCIILEYHMGYISKEFHACRGPG